MLRLHFLTLMLALGALPAPLPGRSQEPPTTIAVSGSIRSAGDRVPLRHARIVVETKGAPPLTVFSDEQGEFLFRFPRDVAYTLNVTKPGYASAALGRSASTKDESLELLLLRGAAVIGRVIGSGGESIAGQDVVLDFMGSAPGPSRHTRTTDDRGEFRFGGLAAGRHALTFGARTMKIASADRGLMIVSTADNSRRPDTWLVTVAAGEERFVELRTPLGGQVVLVMDRATGPGTENAGAGRRPARHAIEGRVFAPGSQPIAGASVRAVPIDGGSERTAFTDEVGQYRLDVAPGPHIVTASAPGFLEWSHGQDAFGRPGLEVDVRRSVADVDVTLPKASVVEGTITDALGEPVEGLTVQLLEPRTLGGRRALVPVRDAEARTDDRGHYRLHGVSPGRYYLRASDDTSPPEPRLSYAPGELVFHPGRELASEALPLEAGAGMDVYGANVIFAPGATARVAGTVTRLDGAPFEGTVSLSSSTRSGIPVLESRATTTDDGAFEFAGVPPGDYVVQALAESAVVLAAFSRVSGTEPLTSTFGVSAEPSEGRTLFGADFVTVLPDDDRVTMVAITARPAITMRGRITLTGDRPRIRPADVALVALPADFDRTPRAGRPRPDVRVLSDWTFEITGVLGPFRLALASSRLPRWWLSSIRVAGIDAAHEPIVPDLTSSSGPEVEIVLSDGASTVEGTVRDMRRQPVAGASIVAFSTSTSRWYEGSPFVAYTGADRNGWFNLAGLAPDEYWVVAVDRPIAEDQWAVPDGFLGLAPSAVRVRVGAGEQRQVDLRAVPALP